MFQFRKPQKTEKDKATEMEVYASDSKDIFFLPNELGQHIFSFFPISALPAISQVSKTWYEKSGIPTLWRTKLSKNQQLKLNTFLYEAIKKGDVKHVLRFCQLGANPNIIISKYISRQYDFTQTYVGTLYSPTMLHYAANHLKGKKGVDIVKILLSFDANKDIQIETTESGAAEYGPVWTNESTCRPLDLTRDNSVKIVLLIADFESKLTTNGLPIYELVNCLRTIFEANYSQFKAYLDELLAIKPFEKYQGLQKVITYQEIDRLAQDETFQELKNTKKSNCLIM